VQWWNLRALLRSLSGELDTPTGILVQYRNVVSFSSRDEIIVYDINGCVRWVETAICRLLIGWWVSPNNIVNYISISNLSVISKLLERLVASQLLSYLNSNNLLPVNRFTELTTQPDQTFWWRLITVISPLLLYSTARRPSPLWWCVLEPCTGLNVLARHVLCTAQPDPVRPGPTSLFLRYTARPVHTFID